MIDSTSPLAPFWDRSGAARERQGALLILALRGPPRGDSVQFHGTVRLGRFGDHPHQFVFLGDPIPLAAVVQRARSKTNHQASECAVSCHRDRSITIADGPLECRLQLIGGSGADVAVEANEVLKIDGFDVIAFLRKREGSEVAFTITTRMAK